MVRERLALSRSCPVLSNDEMKSTSDYEGPLTGYARLATGRASDAERRWLGITSAARAEPAERAVLADALTHWVKIAR